MRHSAGKLLIARGDRSVITIIYLGHRDKRCVHVDDQNMQHKVAATVHVDRFCYSYLEILKMTAHETISHLRILYQTI
jgi:hypothetical protein